MNVSIGTPCMVDRSDIITPVPPGVLMIAKIIAT